MKSANEVLTTKEHEHWAPLLEVAAREVFELMLGCHLTAASDATETTSDITGMVGLAGQLCGVLSVRTNRDSGELMASKMLGVPVGKVAAETADAIGEISNMVAGNFKNKIAGLGDGCMLSAPTVITGRDYSMYSLADCPVLEVMLLFENMPIIINLQIHT